MLEALNRVIMLVLLFLQTLLFVKEYSLLVNEEISIDNSFSIACKYVESLGLQAVTDAFACVREDDWKARCVKYMSSSHKGQYI